MSSSNQRTICFSCLVGFSDHGWSTSQFFIYKIAYTNNRSNTCRRPAPQTVWQTSRPLWHPSVSGSPGFLQLQPRDVFWGQKNISLVKQSAFITSAGSCLSDTDGNLKEVDRPSSIFSQVLSPAGSQHKPTPRLKGDVT